jgi:hypothetical protein
MFKRGLVLAVLAVMAAVVVQVASADPLNAKNGNLVYGFCDGQPVVVSGNGNGAFTPGHVVGSTTVIIPTAFDLTFSFTPTGGQTESQTNTSTKQTSGKNPVTCVIPAALNTVTTPDGTFVISGTVTGFLTPANG